MPSTIILSDNGATSGSAGLKTSGGNDGVLILQTTTSGGTATNAVYVNTSQNVGLGTTPAAKLHLLTTGNTTADGVRLTFGSEARSHNIYSALPTGRDLTIAPYRALTINTGSGTNEGVLTLNAYEYTVFGTGSSYTERMRLDSSGNLGLGATPSAWSVFKVLQIGTTGSFYASSSGSTSVAYNSYYNGSNYTYQVGDVATRYSMSSSGHLWFTATSGTAGNTISFTQAMTLDASGQLGIGTSSPSSSMLHVKGNWVSGHSTVKAQTTTAMSSGGVSGYGIYDSDGTRQMYISADSATLNWWGQANKPFVIAVNDAERVRIDTSGNFIIAKTSTGVATKGMSFAASGNGNAYWSSDFDNTWHVYNWSASAYRFYVSYTGTVYYTTLSQLSDEREKENIVDTDRGLAEVLSLRPVKFDWRDGTATNVSGFIAQEMQQVIPEFVDEAKHDEDGNTRLRVSTSELIPVLVKAIQEQQAIITQLQADVAALKGQA